MERARTIWWPLTKRRGKLATFPGQCGSARRVGRRIVARLAETITECNPEEQATLEHFHFYSEQDRAPKCVFS